jgi:hypothetical protein
VKTKLAKESQKSQPERTKGDRKNIREIHRTEAMEEMMIINRKISEYFAVAGFARTALKFKSEACVFAFQLGRVAEVPEIMNQFSAWPSIDSMHLKYLLSYNIEHNSAEALKNIIEICSLGYFSPKELQNLWGKAYELSKTCTVHATVPNVSGFAKKHSYCTQGDVFTLSLNLQSSLKFPLALNSLSVRFKTTSFSQDLESRAITLSPGSNTVSVSGIFWEAGIYKLDCLIGSINKLTCFFASFPVYIEVCDSDPMVLFSSRTVPFLPPSLSQLYHLDIRTINQPIVGGVLSLSPFFETANQSAGFATEALLHVLSQDVETTHTVPHTGQFCLPPIPPQSWCCFVLTLQRQPHCPLDCLQFEAQLSFDNSRYCVNQQLHFDSPLAVSLNTVKTGEQTLLCIQITNRTSVDFTVNRIETAGCEIIEDATRLPACLNSSQEVRLVSVVGPFSSATVTVFCRSAVPEAFAPSFLQQFSQCDELAVSGSVKSE